MIFFFFPIVSCCGIIFDNFSMLINWGSPTLVTRLQGTWHLQSGTSFQSLIPVVSNVKCFCLSLMASDGNFIKTVSIRFAVLFSSSGNLQDYFFLSTKIFAGKDFFVVIEDSCCLKTKKMLLLNVGTGQAVLARCLLAFLCYLFLSIYG